MKTILTCVVMFAVLTASCTSAAEPTTTTTTTTTTTLPSTTTSTVPSAYRVPDDVDARAWAEDALAYAEQTGWTASGTPMGAGFNPFAREGVPQPIEGPVVNGKVFPEGTAAVNNYGKLMCQLLVAETEVQVEARMRSDLGIERWEDYGLAWFDSLVDGLCIRR